MSASQLTGREIVGGAVAMILPNEGNPFSSDKMKCKIYLRAVANCEKTRVDVIPSGPFPTDILEVAKCSVHINDPSNDSIQDMPIAQWSFSINDWKPFNMSRLETTLPWKLPLLECGGDSLCWIGKTITLIDSDGAAVGNGIIERN